MSGLVNIISIHAAQEGCDTADFGDEEIPFYFNPRSPRGLRHAIRENKHDCTPISIHAAQEGCDITSINEVRYQNTFQSTQPKRAATKNPMGGNVMTNNFNPRSPRGLRWCLMVTSSRIL